MLNTFSEAHTEPSLALALAPALEPALKPVRIIAVGSPYGDDALAWAATAALRRLPEFRQRLAGRVSLLERDRPGVGLVDLLRGAALTVIVDAVVDGGPPGRLLRLDDLRQLQATSQPSSHGFGLAEGLLMAQALGVLSGAWVVLGVSIAASGPESVIEARLSAPVAAAIKPLAQALVFETRLALPLPV